MYSASVSTTKPVQFRTVLRTPNCWRLPKVGAEDEVVAVTVSEEGACTCAVQGVMSSDPEADHGLGVVAVAETV